MTHEGYKKIRMPPSSYFWLKEWYDDAKRHRDLAEETSAGPCMNQREVSIDEISMRTRMILVQVQLKIIISGMAPTYVFRSGSLANFAPSRKPERSSCPRTTAVNARVVYRQGAS